MKTDILRWFRLGPSRTQATNRCRNYLARGVSILLGIALILLHHLSPRRQDHLIPALLQETLPLFFIQGPGALGRCSRGRFRFRIFTRDLLAEVIPGYQVLSVGL